MPGSIRTPIHYSGCRCNFAREAKNRDGVVIGWVCEKKEAQAAQQRTLGDYPAAWLVFCDEPKMSACPDYQVDSRGLRIEY